MFARTLALAASLALFSQVTSVSAANKCVRDYTVKAGDICDSISAANNVSTYQLAALNPTLINPACSNLVPGSTLCLGSEGEDCTSTYIVKPGNSCSQIYKAGGVNATIFGLNNPQVDGDCTNIYVGQVLCVSTEVRVPPAPGVPIHTEPPTSATFANTATATPAATPAPTNTGKSEDAVVTPAPAAAAPTKSASAGGDEEDCEEFEVVEGDTDEDLPFCDELV